MMKRDQQVPASVLVSAAIGAVGYTLPFFLIALYLVSFYAAPLHAALPGRISNVPILGVSLLTLIILMTRAWDMVVDPWIANRSDASKNPQGRRLPFMRRAFILGPAAIAAVFWNPVDAVSHWNGLWALFALFIGISALSAYTTPFLALLASLGNSKAARLSLATAQGLGESTGIILAGQAAFLWSRLETSGIEPLPARQLTFLTLALVSVALLAVPLFLMKDRETPADHSQPALGFMDRVAIVRACPGFVAFLLAYFAFIMSIELVQAGAYFFVSVLLELPDSRLSMLMTLMVPSSVLAVPLTNYLAARYPRRRLVLVNFLWMGALLAAAAQLGRYPVSNEVQALILFVLAGVPLGSMTVLGMAVVMDSAAAGKAGSEAAFISARNLAYKCGITMGAAVFASVALLGHDRGNDAGIRIACAIGAGLCVFASTVAYSAMGKMLHSGAVESCHTQV